MPNKLSLQIEFQIASIPYYFGKQAKIFFRSMAAKDAPIQGRSKQCGRSLYNKVIKGAARKHLIYPRMKVDFQGYLISPSETSMDRSEVTHLT